MSLSKIQQELKAPKGQFNAFGKYKYRSCEDILEAVKPVLYKYKTSLIIDDEIVLIGDRFYVKATAKLSGDDITAEATAYAREPMSKKGMDESQITGAASSYARKYALNGLFAIDDTKDTDTIGQPTKTKLNNEQVLEVEALISKTSTKKDMFLKFFKVKSLEDLPFEKAINALNTKLKKAS